MNTIILTGMAWAASLKDAIASRIGEERGQDMIEYAVLAGGLAIALAIVFFATPINFTTWRNSVDNCLHFDMAGCP